MHSEDHLYYRRRAAIEKQRAAETDCGEAATIHLRLAASYDLLAGTTHGSLPEKDGRK